ncbi:MAG TPA: phytoene desaturase family protein [Flavisolibacter sp.]|nr:phytoene desaturase family protein [Flavisolibacter sp.]
MSKKLVIIGAGFAGLSAAAFMAKAGWKVTVVEKNDTAGGRAKQLKAEGFSFDMGPSWYWMPDVFERFFEQFGKKVSDYYELIRLDPSYRMYWQNQAVDIPANYDELRNLFESIEEGSAEKLDHYLKEAFLKYKIGVQDLVYKPGQSLTEFLDWKIVKNIFKLDVFTSIRSHVAKHFKDERLRQLMEFPILFLGALPQNTPALYSLMNYADIVGGTWYPKGGMFSVVEAMQKLAEEQGARFHFEEEVHEMIIENKKAKKIVTNKGEYEADVIISGADYHFTESQLLSSQYRSYDEAYWEKKALAPSCLLYYVGLNKKLDNLPHHSLFFDVPFEKHADEIYSNPQWPDEPLFYLSVTSKTDDAVAPAGCENLVVLIPVASGLKNDSELLREFYFQKIVHRLEKHANQSITDAIIFKKTFSVSDFETEYHSYKGNAYGLANTLKQTAIFRPSCRSKKVKNLFYTGQLTVPGPGVPPSLISGEVVSKQVQKYFNH